jgi:hypothetical protein
MTSIFMRVNNGKSEQNRLGLSSPHRLADVVGSPFLEPQGFNLFQPFAEAKNEVDKAFDVYNHFKDAQRLLAYNGTTESDIVNNVVARAEDLLSFLVLLRDVSSVAGFIATVHLYVRTHYPAPITPLIWEQIKPLFDQMTSVVKDNLAPQGSGIVDDSMNEIRGIISDWRRHRDGPLGQMFGNVVSILVSFGFFPEWENNGFQSSFMKALKVKTWNVQKDAVNFMDMITDTLLFFLSRGYAAYLTGDLSLLLFADDEAQKMEDEYSLLISALPLLEAGRLDDLARFGQSIIDASDYEIRLEKLIATMLQLLPTVPKPAASQLGAKILNLKKVRTKLILAQQQSCIREKPFTVMIHGPSAVGKSEINAKLIKILLNHNGFPSSKEHVVTLNDGDKYQSEYHPYHNAVTVDDFGNTKAEYYDSNPTKLIIDFANNVPIAVLKAGVESKGNEYFIAKLFTITTNVKSLMAHTFSNEPVSILRRFDAILDVRLRPEFVDALTGGLDGSKMEKFIEDAWIIDLQRVEIIRTGDKETGVRDSHKFVDILKGASFRECLDVLKTMSAEHYAIQKRFVASVENAYDVELCEHGDLPAECPLCWDQKGCQECSLEEQSGDISEDVLKEIHDSINMDTYCEERSLQDQVKEWYDEHFPQEAIDAAAGTVRSLVDVVREHHEEILKGCAIGAISIVAIIGAIKLYRTFAKMNEQLELQGNAMSLSDDKETVPLAQPRYSADEAENVWKTVRPISVPHSSKSKCTVAKNFDPMLWSCIQRCEVTWPDKSKKVSMIIPMRGCAWLVPTHMLPDDDSVYTIEILRRDTSRLGNVVKERVSSFDWVRVGGDLTLVLLASAGPMKDLSAYLAEGEVTGTARIGARLFDLKPDFSKVDPAVRIGSYKEYKTGVTSFMGFDYRLPYNTYSGLCMAPIVSLDNAILGFHLAGNSRTGYGAAQFVSSDDFNNAYTKLRSVRLVAHSADTMRTERFGVDFEPSQPIPKKHAVRFMEAVDGKDPSLEVFGAHGMGVPTFRSEVQKSPISDSVDEIMDLPRLHGRPDGRQIWKHWQRDLHSIAHTRGDFEPVAWKRASDDLQARFAQVCVGNPSDLELIEPLGWYHTLSGIDGVKSIDRINTKSSMGFPLNKSKSMYIDVIDLDVPGVTEAIDFTDPQFRSEFDLQERQLAEGRRIYTIFRGNLKDEPTKFTKDKIRVFAGSEVVFTLLTRKYFLPVVKFIQDHGLELECAVGLNAFGPVWDDVSLYLTKYGDDRMIAGDYKAFDKTASSKAMMSAFEVLIGVARLAGYNERSLTIMEGIATEISYPVYEFNGVILQAFGSNPSGHPLTVIVNNLINSLYLRYAYYVLHEDSVVPMFHDRIAALCYGDDNVMGVSPDETKFTHTAVSKVLGEAGITYTMADKKSESVPLINLRDINFLKRGFRYEKELERYVAPIEEMSISKLLHNVKGKKASPADVSFMALHTANREYFLYGREVFEEKRQQLEQVGCRHFGSLFSLPGWEELVETFGDEEKLGHYIRGDESFDEKLFPQSGDASLVSVDVSELTDDLSKISTASGEEELTSIIVDVMKNKPLIKNEKLFGKQEFGEIDLVYGTYVHAPGLSFRVYINIEVKITKGDKQRWREVCDQSTKYGKMLNMMTGLTVYSCVATEVGFTVIQKIRGKYMRKEADPLADQHVINYLRRVAKEEYLELRLKVINKKKMDKKGKVKMHVPEDWEPCQKNMAAKLPREV